MRIHIWYYTLFWSRLGYNEMCRCFFYDKEYMSLAKEKIVVQKSLHGILFRTGSPEEVKTYDIWYNVFVPEYTYLFVSFALSLSAPAFFLVLHLLLPDQHIYKMSSPSSHFDNSFL